MSNQRERTSSREHVAPGHDHGSEHTAPAPASRSPTATRGEQLLDRALAELRTDHPSPAQLRRVMRRLAPPGSPDESAMLEATHRRLGNGFVNQMLSMGVRSPSAAVDDPAPAADAGEPAAATPTSASTPNTTASSPTDATATPSSTAPETTTSTPASSPSPATATSGGAGTSTGPVSAAPTAPAVDSTPVATPTSSSPSVAPEPTTTPPWPDEELVTRGDLNEEVHRGAARQRVANALDRWQDQRLTGLDIFRGLAQIDDPKAETETDWLEQFVKNAIFALLSGPTFGALDFIAGRVIGKLKGAEKMREMVEAPRPSKFYRKVLVPSDKDPGKTTDNDAAIAAVQKVMGQVKQHVGARVGQELGGAFSKKRGRGRDGEQKEILVEFVARYRSAINHINLVQSDALTSMTGVNVAALDAYASAVREHAASAVGAEAAICAREWALAIAHSVHGTTKDGKGKVTKLDKPKPNEWAPGSEWNEEKGGLLQIELDMGYSDGDPRSKPKSFEWKHMTTSGINQATLAQLIHIAGGNLGKVAMPKMITIRTGSDLGPGTIGLLVDEHGNIQHVHKHQVPGGIALFDRPEVLWALIKAAPIPAEFRLSHRVVDQIREHAGGER